jgi:hypothetical protein
MEPILTLFQACLNHLVAVLVSEDVIKVNLTLFPNFNQRIV